MSINPGLSINPLSKDLCHDEIANGHFVAPNIFTISLFKRGRVSMSITWQLKFIGESVPVCVCLCVCVCVCACVCVCMCVCVHVCVPLKR